MVNLIDLDKELNGKIEFCGDSAPSSNVQDATADKIRQMAGRGYRIIVGNNPNMAQTQKWAGRDLVRLSQVNSRFHGYCLRTIWAVK